jgi:hypothetical protein
MPYLCIDARCDQCAPLGAIVLPGGQQAGAQLACQLDVEANAAVLQ